MVSHDRILKGGVKMMEEEIIVRKLTCERCLYAWIPRKEELPVTCPQCGSPYWNRPRKLPSLENGKLKK